jgi:hypothetical protein
MRSTALPPYTGTASPCLVQAASWEKLGVKHTASCREGPPSSSLQQQLCRVKAPLAQASHTLLVGTLINNMRLLQPAAAARDSSVACFCKSRCSGAYVQRTHSHAEFEQLFCWIQNKLSIIQVLFALFSRLLFARPRRCPCTLTHACLLRSVNYSIYQVTNHCFSCLYAPRSGGGVMLNVDATAAARNGHILRLIRLFTSCLFCSMPHSSLKAAGAYFD